MAVFLRADLNVPLAQGNIVDDFKLQALVPTLQKLQQRNVITVIATHLGRPEGKDPALSTKPLAQWLRAHGFPTEFAADILAAHELEKKAQPGSFIMLENLRFWPEEKTGDKEFAHQLAGLADEYINDAFAVMHRKDTSVTVLPLLYPPSKRSLGQLVHRELQALETLLHPEKPFVLIVGGGKVADKLPLLMHMLDRVSTILLCPAIVCTFMKAMGKEVGKSLVDDSQVEAIKTFMQQAADKGVSLEMPVDFQVAANSLSGPLSISTTIPSDSLTVSIGPKTAMLYRNHIINAKTVFFNGLPGMVSRPETLVGAAEIFRAMTVCPGYTVIGGGDSVGAARHVIDINKLGYVSTGGGATLAYLAGEKLPGLQPFRSS